MSTSYYLVQTEPTPLYGQVKVAQTSGGKTFLWPDTEAASVGDLKALVASGRYRLMDEYGNECDVEEVFG